VVAAFGSGALLLMTVALLLATLFSSALRWAAVLPAAAGLAFAATPERFDIYVDREGAGAAVRTSQLRLVLLGRPSGFVTEQWLRADGDGREAKDPSLRKGVRCDRSGCVTRLPDGRAISFVQDFGAFEEDCRRAAMVISRLRAPAHCAAPLVIDAAVLRERGAVAVRATENGFNLSGARHRGEPRPWDRTRPARQAPAAAQTRAPPEPQEPSSEPEPGPSSDERG
jgi:competence protein ComEC